MHGMAFLPRIWTISRIWHRIWVADSMLVEYVMIRAVNRLGNTPFDAFDPQQNYTRARRALIGEAVTLLDISSRKSG
jgi:hypothetical protein